VQPGNTLGNIAMAPVAPATTGGSTAPATITGQVTTQSPAFTPAPSEVTIAALQTFNVAAAPANFIIPLVHQWATLLPAQKPASILTISTVQDASCAAGVACAPYSIAVLETNPLVGTFNATASTTYSFPVADQSYSVRATPSLTCSNTSLTMGPFTVTAGVVRQPDVNFALTGCQ
jgi:hypothetical protein